MLFRSELEHRFYKRCDFVILFWPDCDHAVYTPKRIKILRFFSHHIKMITHSLSTAHSNTPRISFKGSNAPLSSACGSWDELEGCQDDRGGNRTLSSREMGTNSDTFSLTNYENVGFYCFLFGHLIRISVYVCVCSISVLPLWRWVVF